MTAIKKLAGHFSETRVDDEVVVMHLGTGDFFSLKDSAKAIWEQIDGERSRSDHPGSLGFRRWKRPTRLRAHERDAVPH